MIPPFSEKRGAGWVAGSSRNETHHKVNSDSSGRAQPDDFDQGNAIIDGNHQGGDNKSYSNVIMVVWIMDLAYFEDQA